MKEIKAYLTDRFAQAIREANPNIGDASYARAEFYANEVYRYIIEKNDELTTCLQEAVDLMTDVKDGTYKPDSFTVQPWRKAITNFETTSEM